MSLATKDDLVAQLKALGINEKTAKYALSSSKSSGVSSNDALRRTRVWQRINDDDVEFAGIDAYRNTATMLSVRPITAERKAGPGSESYLPYRRAQRGDGSLWAAQQRQPRSLLRSTLFLNPPSPIPLYTTAASSVSDIAFCDFEVFSGNAGKDEVSDNKLRRVVSPRVLLGSSNGQSAEKMTSSSFKRWGKNALGMGKRNKEERPLTLDTGAAREGMPEAEESNGLSRNVSLTQFSTTADDGDSDSSSSANDHSSPLSPTISHDDQASNLIMGAMSRGRKGRTGSDSTGGALAAIGLKGAGITGPVSPAKTDKPLVQKSKPVGGSSSKARAPSPFFRARRNREKQRARDASPEVGALEKDAASESDGESIASRSFRPQTSAWTDDEDEADLELDSDPEFDELDDDELALIDDDGGVKFDDETTQNTEANSVFYQGDNATLVEEDGRLDQYGEDVEQDVLGEGPNVVVPPEPLFPVSYMAPIKKRKTLDSGLELQTSRPSYARDRCTINLTHGDPDASLEESNKRLNRYVVLSDLSEESKYAVEWAIGTVARDGDEVFLISVKEDESKVDPKSWSDGDKSQKVKVQRERQQMALLLTKQVTSLLQRTRLNITVTCQFLHAKNSRHMLLDLIDFLEPTMVIVGSRGLGKLKGILLGSTSHYLVQKSSVPVMVARRRLQRPLRKTNPSDLRHSPRVSLASASIEKAASSKQEDEVVDVAKEEEGGVVEPQEADPRAQ